jgi:hypothetical protein
MLLVDHIQLVKLMISITLFCCRCKRWVVNSRTQSLDGMSSLVLNAGYLLCSEHFESSQFINADTRCSLIHNAVPTIFSVPNPPKRLASARGEPPARSSVRVKRPRITTICQLSKVNDSLPTKAALLKSIESNVISST